MKAIYLFSFILIATLSHGQSITGVVQSTSGELLPGANVYIENTFIGGSTNNLGIYLITPQDTGLINIVVEYVGFEKTIQTIPYDGNELNIDFKIKEAFNELKAVTITAGNYGSGKTESPVVMSSLDIVTTAGSLGDINAAMRTLPGTSNNGESGKLFVHGGDGSETGTYIDGIFVHQPYTTSAPNLAVRGRYNPFMFEGTSFSTGGYSAEYGQALSSILTLETKRMPLENALNISIMTIGGDVAGTRMWKKGAITGSVKYMNLKPYMNLVPQNYLWNKAPQNAGGSFNFRQKTKGSGIFKVYASMDATAMEQQILAINNSSNDFKLGIKNKNLFINTNWKGSLSDKVLLSLGSSFTLNSDQFTNKQGAIQNELKGNHAKAKIRYSINEKIKVVIGSELFTSTISQKYSLPNTPLDSTISYSNNTLGAFTEIQSYLSNNLLINVGLRADVDSYIQSHSIGPRVSLAYKLKKGSSISAAYGTFFQNPNSKYLLQTNNLEMEKCLHYILSFQKSWGKRLLRIETYYKEYNNLVKLDNVHLNNSGFGYSSGFDVYFKDDKTIKNGKYWISYSFINSKRNYAHYPELATPNFVVPHSLSFVYKHWLVEWRSYVGAAFRYGSPRTYNDLNSSEFNTAKLPSNSSLDLNWSYLFRDHIIFYASVTNVLGAEQVFGYQYTPNPDGNQFSSTPILPAAKRFFFIGCFITLTKNGQTNQLDKIN